MSDPSLTLQCACYWLSCQLRVTLFEEDGTGSVELILPRKTLLERIQKAFRYLIKEDALPVAEVCLTKEQVEELRRFLDANEYLGWEKEFQGKRQEEFNRWMARELEKRETGR